MSLLWPALSSEVPIAAVIESLMVGVVASSDVTLVVLVAKTAARRVSETIDLATGVFWGPRCYPQLPQERNAELVLLFALQVFSCRPIYSVKVIRIIYTWPEKTHFVFQGGEEAYKGGEFWNVKVKGWIGDELS